ncbi:cyclic 3',5'-adenosine monophosphate phosphodiesterase [Enhygromyxa salina]|uniref:Cyclic 3',5'-adenosine monophosphate phosphodiesterase n=1 Tax=Enhygromyxa salina TaxID=215803 RepID=A0A2S9YHW4_9BACT|nr:metallophosphoesterase [Enhygromyxa salina]PRQ04703.1 cyclic 3',5'-adenosine monophosphate phosphodiesterase [Enhygromyxa salina]
MPLRFLHCSDIHLLSLRGVGPHRFINKRLTGGVNLLLKRGKHHDEALFDRMVEHARALAVDRVVITGDLTNLALEQEFEHVVAKLEGVGLPITIIPGNHDAYTRGSMRTRRFEIMLGQYMDGERGAGDEAYYPFVQRFGEVALIGVSTAHASLPLYAVGTVGAAQLERLDEILARLDAEGLARVVLIHHPVMPGVAKRRHDLLDIDAFGQVIARRGAELILHGHEHVAIEGTIPGPREPVPVHGVSSGTNLSQHPGREAAFCVYRIEGRSIERDVHRWDGEDFRLVEGPSAAPAGAIG